ncbi:hypothetical protein KBY66_13230 [Synechococcus sp. Tobar12-5m-g]|uniref:hypothetical protein n=1 Tax=unclassified Synechococcus TaxID=2626047 RepID=UPI0020CE07AA|nr:MULTISPECIES: hypothetical protein [unclassified Synechococcus]MCP9773563.1 hypothetical protein [Synechococcus sp. Tobar12-5m-g]MCP9874516.1 hypothetical protein [Synechococcus sp. Cruz CV-v-12]
MSDALRFVLSSSVPDLAGPLLRWTDLVRQQAATVRQGKALRIYRCPDGWSGSLQDLLASGKANHSGQDPFAEQADGDRPPGQRQRRLVCDALIPSFDPAGQWLEVYSLEDPNRDDSAVQRLDSLPLQAGSNETCWFYPTEDGHYLSWENPWAIRCDPGHVFELPPGGPPSDYGRDQLKVLWSLMADDANLTCVGFTYQRKRIEFPLIESSAGAVSTWSSFVVDSISATPLKTISTMTI